MKVLGICPPYVKKYFPQGKCFFLYGSSYSDSLVSMNADLGEIKGHSLKTTPIQNLFFLWKF